MPAPTANKNAEKWTLERTLEVLNQIDQFSQSSDCLYLGHALCLVGYYDDIWVYWKRKWKGCYQVIHMMKRIIQRFECRLFEKMAHGAMPSRVAGLALSHHYGWGREAKDEAKLDLDYLEPQEDEPASDLPTETQTEETQQPAEEIIIVEPSKSSKEYNYYMVTQYNKLYPHSQILTPAAYFDGPPPRGLPAIIFEDGYFLKAPSYI